MKVWQQPLPQIYNQLSDAELRVRIASAKETLGERLVILGHHYQQDGVIEFADFTGDSFELSRRAAEQKGAEYVIFCGVHFMAESADILTPEGVSVMLPDLGAGCSMADMANLDQTLDCWAQLQETCPDQTVVPITYMNSSAAIKAFVGEHGGAVCTSSNCRNVLEWALAPSPSQGEGRGEGEDVGTSNDTRISTSPPSPRPSPWKGEGGKKKILFFPDQHLGRNTAYSMGYPLDKMVVWDPNQDLGGNDARRLREADFVLWKGHCSVHQLFRPEHVDQVRAQHPGMKVIVHPECRWEVVQKADDTGSTAYIVKQIEAAPAGSKWAVGTEVHLINRLARQHPEQQIIVLSECQCLCTTMYRIDLPHLCWTLENLVEGRVVNQIKVDKNTRQWALVALDRMLTIKGMGSPSAGKSPAAAGALVD
ncbi:MAG: Quinolinate synthetase [Phycisphaerales bacterium]|nr:Quinolinate synthetase [Phycisphaerales bacterium]